MSKGGSAATTGVNSPQVNGTAWVCSVRPLAANILTQLARMSGRSLRSVMHTHAPSLAASMPCHGERRHMQGVRHPTVHLADMSEKQKKAKIGAAVSARREH